MPILTSSSPVNTKFISNGKYDYRADVAESIVAYWEKQPTDVIGDLNAFNGTFAISSIDKVPDSLMPFLIERFGIGDVARKSSRDTLTIEKVNETLNEVWEGPGSMVKVAKLTEELRVERVRLSELED